MRLHDDPQTAADTAMSTRAAVITLLRVFITAALLWWVFSHEEVREGLHAAHFQKPWWLVAGVFCGGVAALLGALRWQACLRACDCALPFSTTLRISLAGNAAGLLSVGALGDDAVRVALASRQLPEKKRALLASVALDHVSAVPVMLVVAALIVGGIGLSAEMNHATIVTIAVSAALFFGTGIILRFIRPELHARILRYVKAKLFSPGAGRAMLISIPLQLAYHGIFWCAANALALSANPFGLFGAFVVADTIAALPVTIAGLGVREKSIELLLLQWYAVPRALSVKASLTGLAILALWAAIGAACFPIRRKKEDAK
jgi:glycosyltransferase 2 family protein